MKQRQKTSRPASLCVSLVIRTEETIYRQLLNVVVLNRDDRRDARIQRLTTAYHHATYAQLESCRHAVGVIAPGLAIEGHREYVVTVHCAEHRDWVTQECEAVSTVEDDSQRRPLYSLNCSAAAEICARTGL
jgi:hypothetical protein